MKKKPAPIFTGIERSYLLELLLPDLIASDSNGNVSRHIFLKTLYKKIEGMK